MLKERLLDMLSDSQRTSLPMKIAQLQKHSKKQIKRESFSRLKKIFKYKEQFRYGLGSRLDISRRCSQYFTAPAFSKNAVIGILEASDFECIDQATRFLGAFTYDMCGDECEPEATLLFMVFSKS